MTQAENARKAETIIVGLGKTGLSVARFLAARGESFLVMDSRSEPPGLAQLRAELPEVRFVLGAFDVQLLSSAKRLLVSPGVAVAEPALQAAQAAGAVLTGDVDLFCAAAKAPIVAITGSNAKSTVTTLLGLMARQAGLRVGVGGNLGIPMLELLEQGSQDLYVLELSSFQLETAQQLRTEVVTLLNLSEDHLDRYASFESYRQAKLRIFRGCRKVVDNLDAPQRPLMPAEVEVVGYRMSTPGPDEFGILSRPEGDFIAFGEQALLSAAALKIKGTHNLSNALAALALGRAAGLPHAAMIEALQNFTGLAHRCQWVAKVKGVDYINDSKGTNPGASVAAVTGLAQQGVRNLLLIAGGDGKGASFEPLREPLREYCKALVLIGRDAARMETTLGSDKPPYPILRAGDMAQAVQLAAAHAQAGDIVLLSPACASLDMYRNFEARGDEFAARVRSLSC